MYRMTMDTRRQGISGIEFPLQRSVKGKGMENIQLRVFEIKRKSSKPNVTRSPHRRREPAVLSKSAP